MESLVRMEASLVGFYTGQIVDAVVASLDLDDGELQGKASKVLSLLLRRGVLSEVIPLCVSSWDRKGDDRRRSVWIDAVGETLCTVPSDEIELYVEQFLPLVPSNGGEDHSTSSPTAEEEEWIRASVHRCQQLEAVVDVDTKTAVRQLLRTLLTIVERRYPDSKQLPLHHQAHTILLGNA